MIRKRSKPAGSTVAEPDSGQIPETAPDDLAAAAGELRAQAAEARTAAEQDRANAQEQMTAAPEAAARLVNRTRRRLGASGCLADLRKLRAGVEGPGRYVTG
jgi:hypothetical protein